MFSYFIFLIGVYSVSAGTDTSTDAKWCYKIYRNETCALPDKWGTVSVNNKSSCDGTSQSPININSGESTFDPSLTPIKIVRRDNAANEVWSIRNTDKAGK
jgi:carbonic anhydrase